MLKIFNRDPYAQIERRKKKALKEHKQAREKSWRRKNRRAAWRNFKKRLIEIISNPFSRKKPTPHRHTSHHEPEASGEYRRSQSTNLSSADRKKAWKRRERAKQWQHFKTRLNNFLAHPFAKRKSTSVANSSGDRKKAWKRKERAKNRLRFIARFNNFLAHPFAKKELASSATRSDDRKKAWKRRERAKNRQRFKARFNDFLAHPFAKKELTSEQRMQRQIKRQRRHDRKLARKKLFDNLRANPLSMLFPPKKGMAKSRKSFRINYRIAKEYSKKKLAEAIENYELLKSTPDVIGKFVKTFLLSTAYYIIAFLIIYVVYQVVTILVASYSHISGIWYYYQLKFPLNSPLYTRANLILIFASGPLVSLLLALASLKMFFVEKNFFKRFRLFFLWGFICGVNMFFGAYIVGFLTRTEFIYTSEWLFLSNVFDIEEIIFTLISFGMLIVIGRIVTPLFLVSSGSVTLIKPEFRLYFILSHVILPWLVGVLVLFLITLPNYYIPLIFKTITPALILFPSLIIYNSRRFAKIHKSGVVQHNYFRWSIIIVFFALLLFYRVILNFGLRLF